jgi:ribosomal protein S18 acetylase RimI-like enzyme
MLDSRATPERQPLVRRMSWDDIPEILRIANRTPASPWVRPDFLNVFQSSETVGYVALDRERVAGFALCSIVRPPEVFDPNGAGFLDRLFAWLRGRGRRRRHLELFGLGVVPDCPRPEVERALLEAIVWDFGDRAETIRAVVPETSVAAQTFLRGRGFQAVRVFRGYYGREDGYLMRRESGRLPSRPCPGRDGGGHRPSVDGTELRREGN